MRVPAWGREPWKLRKRLKRVAMQGDMDSDLCQHVHSWALLCMQPAPPMWTLRRHTALPLPNRERMHAQGAEAVSAYVTHGVFPRDSWHRFIKCNGTADAFKYFWITDSCPRTVAAVQGQQPFEVLSLAGLIAAALQI